MSPRTPHGESPVLEALVDESLDGMVALDRDLRYVFWNRAMERMTGMAPVDVIGRPLFDGMPIIAEGGAPLANGWFGHRLMLADQFAASVQLDTTSGRRHPGWSKADRRTR